MPDKPKQTRSKNDTASKNTADQSGMNVWVGAGIGAGIGSAAIAAALLYANRVRKTPTPKGPRGEAE